MDILVRPEVLWLLLVPVLLPLPPGSWSPPADQRAPDPLTAARERMVTEQIAARDVKDPRVLAAMRQIPRHLFVPADQQYSAYDDRPLPIGYDQTISQPYIVALMTELARPKATDRALEVGTGSGYQAAILSKLVAEVYSIEIIEPLAAEAKARLARMGCTNVICRTGDGYGGWAEKAPFDLIVVTAAPDHVPPPLVAQLKPGGRLVIPVGEVFSVQELLVIEKDANGKTRTEQITPVRFVPLKRKD
jgi:protein-L-isoaspartate(D-aspartate) O-methyltransferase